MGNLTPKNKQLNSHFQKVPHTKFVSQFISALNSFIYNNKSPSLDFIYMQAAE